MNKVIRPFFDLTDNNRPYSKGDTYSHPDEDRIAFLIKQGFLASAKKEKSRDVKHVGGGWYELPNGERVKGKENALAKLGEGNA